jgi:F-type H+-transporting ATPase subunit a
MEHPFTWHSLLKPFLPYPLDQQHTFTALLIMLLLVALAYLARRALLRSSDPVIPGEGLTVRNILELLVEFVAGLSDSIIGRKGRKYVPLFGSFFFFIVTANLFGLLPGFSPPTNNLNTTFGLGLISFCAYHYFGVREHGVGYIKQFMGPVLFLAPFFLILEGVSHMVRPFSLALRLFGNMFGDHLVVEIFTDLTKVVVPVAFYMLGTLVSLIQAFVFTLLSVIYVALAISHEH